MPRKELTIGENDGGQRLDKFLTKAFPRRCCISASAKRM